MKLNEGTGPTVPKGSIVRVHYTGRLADGKVFDSSVGRGEPIEFELGAGQVIKGWDEGISQLQKGQKAVLICPPEFAYGDDGSGRVIPPNATLHFDVEVVDFFVYEAEVGMQIVKHNEGTGPTVPRGAMVKVHYTGKLANGQVFDSSVKRGQPIEFKVGVGQVIKGWDEGIC